MYVHQTVVFHLIFLSSETPWLAPRQKMGLFFLRGRHIFHRCFVPCCSRMPSYSTRRPPGTTKAPPSQSFLSHEPHYFHTARQSADTVALPLPGYHPLQDSQRHRSS